MKIQCYGCGQKLDVSELAPFSVIPCPVCSTSLIVPKTFGELLLEEKLGEGTMATVYRAMDLTLDREIAVKVLLDEHAGTPHTSEGFINEARIASAINHPHVIPIYSCGEIEGRSYIVMQYMGGRSLAARLADEKGPPVVQQILRCWVEAAKGLEGAHLHGVLHGDVKPSNILLDPDGNVKVADFGLSSIVYPDDPLDYQADGFSMPLVRSRYVSPEQVTTGMHDVLSDIYSLGCTMYEALTGKPPFDSDDPRENLRRRFRGAPDSPATVNPEIPGAISELILQMLSVYPSERPGSYAAIANEVKKHLEEPEKPKRSTGPNAARTVRRESPPAEAKAPVVRVPRPSPAALSAPLEAELAAAKAGPGLWFLRLFLALLAAVFLALGLGHALGAKWYDTYVMPHLPAVESTAPLPAQAPATPAVSPVADAPLPADPPAMTPSGVGSE